MTSTPGTEQIAELLDARVVGAIAAADGNRALVEPDDVAAFELTGRLNRAGDRHAQRLERPPLRGRFVLARGFPMRHSTMPRGVTIDASRT